MRNKGNSVKDIKSTLTAMSTEECIEILNYCIVQLKLI